MLWIVSVNLVQQHLKHLHDCRLTGSAWSPPCTASVCARTLGVGRGADTKAEKCLMITMLSAYFSVSPQSVPVCTLYCFFFQLYPVQLLG